MVAERGRPRLAEHIVDVLVPLITEEIVEVLKTVFQEQISERICKQIVEQAAEVPKTSSRDRTLQRAAEQILDVPLLEMVTQLVEVPETVSPDRIQQRTVEQIVDAPVPQVVEELAESFKVFSQDRIQQRAVEQTIEIPAVSLDEKIIEVPVARTPEKAQQGANTLVQHDVNTVEVERSKLVKETVQEKINQVTKHAKVPRVCAVKKTAEIPQVQFLDKVDEIPVMTQRQNHMVQTVQMPMETPQLPCINKVVDVTVATQQVVHVPQKRVVEKIVEIPQLQMVGEIVPDTETSDSLGTTPVGQVAQIGHVEVVEIETSLPTESASAMFVSTPLPQAVEELVEVSKAFSQNRVQQSSLEQIIANPAISLAEKTIEMPDTRTQDKTQHVVNTHVQHVVNTVEAEKPIINETINQVTKYVEIPQLQIVEKTVEAVKHIQQERVKELKSKFEVGHTNKVYARNQPDKNRWRKKQEFEATQYPQDVQERADLTNQRQVPAIRSVQKTVEVPRVQYIDKVADIPVDMQRQQVSTTQAAQDIEEAEDVTALTQSEVPNIPDDDEDWLEQESKKRKLPMPAETVFESRADESDFDGFDGLVLPSLEGKTLFVNIASGDEAEDEPEKQQEMTLSLVQGGESMLVDETDAQGPGRQMVQVVHAEWTQELREVRKKFADDMASEMTDVKNELAHVRELIGVLVRRERSAETKAETPTRRLDRMEREQTEADDAEHEANLQEALANQSKAVKVVVDKWFVDKGYGFGKAPTGEIVFIHSCAVQGAEVLQTIIAMYTESSCVTGA